MNNLWNYIKGLVPTFQRDDLLEDCQMVRSDIADTVIHSYADAIAVSEVGKFKSKVVMDMLDTIKSNSKSSDKPLVTIEKAAKTAVDTLHLLEGIIKEEFGEEVAGIAMTYRRSNILRYIEIAGFFKRYALRFLNFALDVEYIARATDSRDFETTLVKGEVKWLENNLAGFCQAIILMNTPSAKIKSSLFAIPDITITEDNVKTLESTIGSAKMDPLRIGFFQYLPVTWNPIYHIGLMVAEYQAAKYKEAKEAKALLQLRLLNLQKKAEGKNDASLDKQIAYNQSRLEQATYDLAEMEKKYA